MLHEENLYHLEGFKRKFLLIIIYDTQYETRSQIQTKSESEYGQG
jgi:hypothetical protein